MGPYWILLRSVPWAPMSYIVHSCYVLGSGLGAHTRGPDENPCIDPVPRREGITGSGASSATGLFPEGLAEAYQWLSPDAEHDSSVLDYGGR